MRIQLDMFAVELGAAILLQFETAQGVVRVLADGGEARHRVNTRLGAAVGQFLNEPAHPRVHIDLMIGTHYDADHLAGLVAVVRDPQVTIGEAWLPPVANDTEVRAEHVEPDDGDLLALQFAREDGEAVLARYLDRKAAICDRLAAMEHRADEVRGVRREPPPEATFLTRMERAIDRGEPSRWAFFRRHISDANRTLGVEDAGHGDEQIRSPWEDPPPLRMRAEGIDLEDLAAGWTRHRKSRADVEASSLALIRRSAAKDAINATALADVVMALKARNVPMACRTIPDGTPRRFVWRAADRRFAPSPNLASDGPELLLLGPSDSLVRKHWKRLPIGDYALRAAFASLPIEPITPSNQLSYILRVDFAGQRLLVSGDAGCVDFKPSTRGDYFPDLIAALAPLDVIQMAHHAGHNAHFYRCLLEANYAAQDHVSYLLLSHGTDDKHRPSAVFARFVETVRQDGDDVRLLFTSRPQEPKVRDFKALFAPVVGVAASSGDVRLRFDDDGWNVLAHAVAAP